MEKSNILPNSLHVLLISAQVAHKKPQTLK